MTLTCEQIPGLNPAHCCAECHAQGEIEGLHKMVRVILPDDRLVLVCAAQMRQIERKLKRTAATHLEHGKNIYRFPRYPDTRHME
jgi:hypothetical protein